MQQIYSEILREKFIALVKDIPDEDSKFTADFNFGQKFFKNEVIKRLKEIKL